jgi:hypothetical protein
VVLTGCNQIAGLNQSFTFPVKATVVGSPISILTNTFGLTTEQHTMPLSNTVQPVSIRWGCIAPQKEGASPEKRLLKVQNFSPFGMR